MDQKKLQQAFIQYLAQKYQLKSQQELQAKAQELGEEGMKKEYTEFLQYLQQQGVQVARLGAKLNYLRQLRGKCPEGYEVAYYKQGGKTCAVCQKVGTQQQGGNVVEDFKKKRKVEKAKSGNVVQPTPGGQYSNQTFRENGRPVRYESYQDPNGNWYNLRTQGNDSTFYFNSDNGNPNGASSNFEGSKTNGQLNVPQSSWNGAVKVWDMIKNWVSNGQVQK